MLQRINGGSVLIDEADNVTFFEHYSIVDIDKSDVIDQTPIVWIASISKLFTATAILRLEEWGNLNIEDWKTHLVLNLPDSFEQVTIFHLLTHTSGIPDSIPKSAFNSNNNKRLELTEPQLQDMSLESAPGEKHLYSNSGHHLFGEDIESVSETSYAECIEANFLQPLQLNQTGFVSSFPEDLVIGHMLQEPKLERTQKVWAGGWMLYHGIHLALLILQLAEISPCENVM